MIWRILFAICFFSCTIFLSDNCKANNVSDSLLQKFETFPLDEQLDSLVEKTSELSISNDLVESNKIAKFLLINYKNQLSHSVICKLNGTLGQNYFFMALFDSAQIYLRKCISTCTLIQDSSKLFKANLRYANTMERSGKFDSAILYLEQSRSYLSDTTDHENYGSWFNSYGITLTEMGNHTTALMMYQKSVQQYRILKDYKRIGILQNNIGLLLKENDDNELAEEYYRKSISNSRKAEHYTQLAKTYANYATHLTSIEKFDSAEYYYRQAIKIHDKSGSKYSYANVWLNFGDHWLAKGELDSARRYLKLCKDTSEKYRIYQGIFHSNRSLGDLAFANKEYEKSLGHYYVAIQLAQSFDLKRREGTVMQKLAKTHKSLGNLDSALIYLEGHYAIRDSIENVSNQEKFKNLNLQHENELKKEENKALVSLNNKSESLIRQKNIFLFVILSTLVLISGLLLNYVNLSKKFKSSNEQLMAHQDDLDRKNSELNSLNNDLQDALGIKDKLLSVISHDLRSPINNLTGMLRLLQDGAIERKEFNSIIKNLESNLINFSKFSDNILYWVKSQNSGFVIDKKPINIPELIQENISLYERDIELKNIEVKLNAEAGDLEVVADRESINIVIRNLISNAIKFNPEGGCLCLDLVRENNELKFKVRDKGEGMPQELINALTRKDAIKSTLGTKNERGLGLGLTLCNDFLELNNSKLVIESELGKGSEFSFKLPLVMS